MKTKEVLQKILEHMEYVEDEQATINIYDWFELKKYIMKIQEENGS